MEKLKQSDPVFFQDKYNIVYLKLLNLYNKTKNSKWGGQRLYWITEKFSPNNSANSIIEQFKDIIRKIEEQDLTHSAVNTVQKSHKDARKEALALSKKYPNDKYLPTAMRILDMVERNVFDNGNYFDYLADDYHEYFEESESTKAGVNELAGMYCDVYGNSFTKEEKDVLSYELDQTQKSVLSTAMNSQKR